MSCELSLWDHRDQGHTACLADPRHTKALADRLRARDGAWSAIVRGSDGGGLRDFLDGRPIHCGTTLELQALEESGDDYGNFSINLQTGNLVRYELGWRPGGERLIELYTSIGGHTFTAGHEPWMRFRWPVRR